MSARRWITIALAILFFVSGFLVLYQQSITFGEWFQIKDIHHETIALFFVALGIGTLIGSIIAAKEK